MKVYVAFRSVSFEFSEILDIFHNEEDCLKYLRNYISHYEFVRNWISKFDPCLDVNQIKYFESHPTIIHTDGNEDLEMQEWEVK